MNTPPGIGVWMWATFAIVILVVIPLVGYVVKLVVAMSHHTRTIKTQVTNNHGTNLRDDLDANRAKLDRVQDTVTEVERRQGHIHCEVRRDRADLDRLRADMYEAIAEGGGDR